VGKINQFYFTAKMPMNSSQYKNYHPDFILAYQLGAVPEDICDQVPRGTRSWLKGYDFSKIFGKSINNEFDLLKQFYHDKHIKKLYRSYIRLQKLKHFILYFTLTKLNIPKRCDNVRLKNLKMPYRTAFFAF